MHDELVIKEYSALNIKPTCSKGNPNRFAGTFPVLNNSVKTGPYGKKPDLLVLKTSVYKEAFPVPVALNSNGMPFIDNVPGAHP